LGMDAGGCAPCPESGGPEHRVRARGIGPAGKERDRGLADAAGYSAGWSEPGQDRVP
jgi:hypothetical protein